MRQALAVLDEARSKSDSAIVFYSGGKDSRVIADLASRTFDRLVLVFMYFVKGLSFCEEMLSEATTRYRAEVRQYPHLAMTRAYRDRVFCWPNWSATGGYDKNRKLTAAHMAKIGQNEVPELGLRDIYDLAKSDMGIPVIIHGAKKCDSSFRRRYLQSVAHWTDVYYPIVNWSKHDVLAFCAARGIKVPEQRSRKAAISGLCLVESELVSLFEDHPEDFKRLEEVFLYARAAVMRRRWYGQEEHPPVGADG
jgi:3'-phosphoadenosine 5'-phosphosulfate sulfotransferase (PAPS reductase)/FAD synthetase